MTTLTLSPEARHEFRIFGALAAVFAFLYVLPVGQPRFDASVTVGPGEHTVCAYGIAIDAGEPNTWLGCRTVRTGGA